MTFPTLAFCPHQGFKTRVKIIADITVCVCYLLRCTAICNILYCNDLCDLQRNLCVFKVFVFSLQLFTYYIRKIVMPAIHR